MASMARSVKFNWKRNHVEFFERNEFTTGTTQANKNEFPTASRLGNVGLRLEEA